MPGRPWQKPRCPPPSPTLVVGHRVLHAPPQLCQPLLVVIVLQVLSLEALDVNSALRVRGLDGGALLCGAGGGGVALGSETRAWGRRGQEGEGALGL